MVHVDKVLMDREFDSEHVLEMISQRGLSYVVAKRMQTSEKAQASVRGRLGRNSPGVKITSFHTLETHR